MYIICIIIFSSINLIALLITVGVRVTKRTNKSIVVRILRESVKKVDFLADISAIREGGSTPHPLKKIENQFLLCKFELLESGLP
jgi:hypothetical protein